MQIVPIIIASMSLLASGYILWDNYFRKGSIRMTHPTLIAFIFDGIKGPAKVFVRTLLFNTSKKGQIVENLFLKLKHKESTQIFNVWGYGEKDLVRGGGIYVPPTGVVHNHHFITPKTRPKYIFISGDYLIEIYAVVFGKKKPIKLYGVNLSLDEKQSMKLAHRATGIVFDWNPESKEYIAYEEEPSIEKIAELLSN